MQKSIFRAHCYKKIQTKIYRANIDVITLKGGTRARE